VLLGFVSIFVISFKLRGILAKKKEEQLRLLEKEKLMTVKSELKALRSQINPHFTFNTLSAIRNAINTQEKSVASNYVVSFGKLIRMVLESSKNPTIEIGTEIEMLTLYLDLEALRFSDKFSYSISIDEKISRDSFHIPVMVIQPFVENAILHGLVPKEAQNLNLKISFTLKNEIEILCIIEDNGIGREASRKLNVLKNLNKKSMGMQITQERFDLHYKVTGKKYSFTIIDLIGDENRPEGTRVIIKFPL
jgi:sensor histidine kinase YesM